MNDIAAEACMLDTNVFNDLLDGRLSMVSLEGFSLLVIGVQEDELSRCKPGRREELLAIFKSIAPTKILASSAVFDIEGAGLGQAEWNDGTGAFEKMLARLQELDGKTKSKKSYHNQLRDILIAETAIKKEAILITRDCNLRTVVTEFGGRAKAL